MLEENEDWIKDTVSIKIDFSNTKKFLERFVIDYKVIHNMEKEKLYELIESNRAFESKTYLIPVYIGDVDSFPDFSDFPMYVACERPFFTKSKKVALAYINKIIESLYDDKECKGLLCFDGDA